LLSHLSKENNSPELAKALFMQHAGNTQIVVASRYQASEVFTINGGTFKETVSANNYLKPVQLGLF
jgi:hypothetical protein